ncbi:MAG: molecular chaperone [Pseudomonadota bacterium]
MKARIFNLRIKTLVYIYKFFTLFVLSVTSLIATQNVALAGANLMVTPSRIVFEDRTRTAQVTLLNTGDETGSFRIKFIRQQMTKNGQFVEVKADEKGMFSDPMLRYSPRQISLPPGQSQVIRLMLRKPRNLEKGEYRSHLLFQSIPKSSKSGLESAIKSEQKGITVEIVPVVGISIPAIVRHGKLESSLTLDNARIIPADDANPTARISVDMNRSGNQSVYGDFRAIFTPSDGGAPMTIALVNGVAVYTPNALRKFSIPLRIPQGITLENGNVRVIFLESGKDEKTGLIAETNFSL